MAVLDLHGVRHGDVTNKTDKFIGEHLLKGSAQVIIITGHSKSMKKLVSEVLKDYNLTSETSFFNNGSVNVALV